MRGMRTVGGPADGVHEDDVAHGPESPILGEPGIVSGPTQQARRKAANSQNASISSLLSAFPPVAASGNTYRNRPLPVPPQRPRTAMSERSERPSTSGGPGSASKQAMKPNFDKRMSKDDLYLRSGTSTRSAFKSYHIPIQYKPPTPEGSVRSKSPDPTQLVRTNTPDSVDGQTGTIAIGMALGSPTRTVNVATTSWQPQLAAMSTSLADMNAAPHAEETQVKQKSGRWRLFGRFGSKKHAETSSQRSTPEPVTVTPTPIMPEPAATSAQNSALGRSNTERKIPKYKPIIIRSQTELSFETVPEAKEPPKTPRSLSRKGSTRSIRGDAQRVKKSDISAPVPILNVPKEDFGTAFTMPPPPARPPVQYNPNSSGPLLDVEIPSIKMERYSVMFGSVLQSQPASSLLARRQATLDRLKTINDRITKEGEVLARERTTRPRRATSPQPTKSPAFSLFPTTPSRSNTSAAVPPRLSPLSRSNTSPAMLPSPSKSTFDANQIRKDASTQRLAPPGDVRSAVRRTPSPADRRRELMPQPLRPMRPPQQQQQQQIVIPQETFNFGPNQSNLILDSPTSLDEDAEVIIKSQLKPAIYEPSWQMISPPASTASSSASSMRKRSPSSVSSVQTHVTKPSVDEPDVVLKSAVEISIARQISLSQQQRQLLQPLKTTNVRGVIREISPINGHGRSPVRKINVGKNERLVDTKSATPTLVTPTETLDSQLAQHRKSSRIIVEG
jgi:hypothetical protein